MGAGTSQGPQMALTWVTPNGCESADPLKLLRGRRVSMPHASLDACPSVLRWVQGLSSNTSSAAMEDGLAHLLAEEGIDSKPVRIFHFLSVLWQRNATLEYCMLQLQVAAVLTTSGMLRFVVYRVSTTSS